MKKNMATKAIMLTIVLLVLSLIGVNYYKKTYIIEKTQENLVSASNNKSEIELLLEENNETVKFLCKTFGIKKSKIVNSLKKINKDKKVKVNNVGRLKKSNGKLYNYGSFERGLIEYLYYYSEKYPKNVSNKYVPYEGNALYVENLIKYFTTIYDNVDYLTAVSIGAAESGYYTVSYMLEYNNVYGGMGTNGLIRHNNIEYGVQSYIRMLSKYYYGKGLDTASLIGKVYCPKYVDGKKVASPHWLKLVNKAKKHYKDDEETITVSELLKS